VTMNDLLRTVEADVRRTFGRRIAVAIDVEPSLATVHVDPDQIEDVLSTLAAHSVDAMAQGGTLTLRTRHAEIGADRPRALCFVQAGSYVQIEVTHTGVPLDHDMQMRLFEPFFGDEGLGQHGLGLAAAFGVVKQSGGYIWVDSASGAATTFTLLFPVHERREAVEAPPQTHADASQTIVVVDDEDLIRQFVADCLRAVGYEVLEASAAEDGEQIIASYPGRVDLVIADVNLGGVSGPQLAARLRRRVPDLKLLYISGGHDDHNLGATAHSSFLQKPFGAKLIIQRVRELLGA
jgi:two-component system cell cycle sensor histidine kinase/response regulator CckA